MDTVPLYMDMGAAAGTQLPTSGDREGKPASDPQLRGPGARKLT